MEKTTPQLYLSALSPEKFEETIGLMTGKITPDGGGCNPPCGGPGPTPNGFWTCNNNVCTWVPEV